MTNSLPAALRALAEAVASQPTQVDDPLLFAVRAYCYGHAVRGHTTCIHPMIHGAEKAHRVSTYLADQGFLVVSTYDPLARGWSLAISWKEIT